MRVPGQERAAAAFRSKRPGHVAAVGLVALNAVCHAPGHPPLPRTDHRCDGAASLSSEPARACGLLSTPLEPV